MGQATRLRPEDFVRFKRQAASDSLGWDNVTGQTRLQTDCIGVEITYTYDPDRLQVDGAAPARNAVVLVAAGKLSLSTTFVAHA